MQQNKHSFDVLIIGGGLAGLSAAITAAEDGLSVAIVSKVHPLRSHSGAAQGGIAASLATLGEDSAQWHVEDTIRGGDYLSDRPAVKYLCEQSEETINWLNRMGVPFSRNADGTIAQRNFGGHTKGDGATPVKRACYVADRTGLALLSTLWRKAEALNIASYYETFALKLITESNCCYGVTALQMKDNEVLHIYGKATVLATGGYGQLFDFSTNPLINCGDGLHLAMEVGVPLQDMEFMQFHPTALYPKGHLISEAARAEGGILRNAAGEAFMGKYAPELKDLAPRDVVSRAVWQEMHKDKCNHIYLDLSHLKAKILDEKLPAICELARTFASVEPKTEPIPIAPAAHYSMGGIPVNLDGAVLLDGKDRLFQGLYAVGECASLSVHGANRLGCNSLLEAALFGRRCGSVLKEAISLKEQKFPSLSIHAIECMLASGNSKPQTFYAIRNAIQNEMTEECGISREEQSLSSLETKLKKWLQELEGNRPIFNEQPFNMVLTDYLESLCIARLALIVCTSAKNRKESRGAHWRTDFPNQLKPKHSLLFWGETLRYQDKEVAQ